MEESTKRIVLIGPVLPYRGGISQHTTMLHRAMTGLAEHLTISFSRQYPGWLFPGESDKDPAYENRTEPGVEYLIDSLNPFTWRKAVARASNFKADIAVIPWWTVFWAPCFGYLARGLKRSGIEVVFFCHNVVEHESAGWKSVLTRRVLKHGARFVVHTREDEANLKRLLPGSEVSVHPHPIYDQFPQPQKTLPKRRGLELLFYGFVRPYKGLDTLIEAMGRLKGEDIQLTVAGEFWEGEEDTRARIKELGIEDQVEIRAGYHSDQESADLFARSDVVVLPYHSATGSGVVPLAYHYEKPVIVTRVGGLPDVVQEGRTGLLVEPGNCEALAGAIKSMNRSRAEAMVPGIQELKRSLTWESLVSSFIV
jgi:glycosyltransferase involved in cell wall biosynthesis